MLTKLQRARDDIVSKLYTRNNNEQSPSNGGEGGGGRRWGESTFKNVRRKAHHHCYIVWKFRRHMHKIFDRSDANSTCRACFSRWNTRPSVASVVVSRIRPIPFLPCFIPNLVSWKTEPRLSPSPPPLPPSPLLPLILKLQIERDIRVLFRRMSRWKRSRRDSRPQHPPPPRYYPRLSSDSTNPRQGLNPTQPRRFEEWRGSSQAGCLAHAAFPLPRSTPFPSAFPSSLSTFPSPLSSPHSPPLSRFPTFLRQRRCCHYYYSPTSLWSVSPLPSLPPPAIPAPFSLPFFVISPLLSCLSSPLYYHSPTAAAAVATLPLFLSRASNKREFEELAYRRNSEGKYFLEILWSSARVG